MKYALSITPLLFAAALSAQVPTVPPTPPAPRSAPAPRPMAAPAEPMSPWNPSLDLDIESRVNTAMAEAYSVSAQNYGRAFDNFDYALDNLNYSLSTLNGLGLYGGSGERGPVAWAQNDPADSLYKQARDQFNRGDYRKAAELFKSLPQKYSSSVYVADAQYYQAFSLYRIGGTPELQEALAVLEARKPVTDQPVRGGVRPAAAASSSSSASASSGVGGSSGGSTVYNYSNNVTYSFGRGERSGNDAAGLAARIANVLSTRGMANDAAVKRALAAGGDPCNQDDQSVRAEALSALMQNDPEEGRRAAVKILANKDECSVQLRRNAVMLVGNKHDDAATSTLIPVAKSDPSQSVRMAAVDYLIRTQTDAAINAVIEMARSDTSKQIQRAAVRALAQSTNARARAEVRAIVENNGGDEQLRTSVIDGIDHDRMTAEDATWLRGLYAKTTSVRIKDRIVSAIARTGGDVNNQWLLALVRNDDESLEARTTALEHVGRSMDLATLNKMYDMSSSRPIRQTVLDLLSERKEPEALDKIVEVAKSGTDVEMRRHAISILSRSKDPRASKLLLQLVDH